MGRNRINCQHKNWELAGYLYERDEKGVIRVSSLYEVYCRDCNNFVNLLSKEIINNKGLVRI
jgi:hypothetical protein